MAPGCLAQEPGRYACEVLAGATEQRLYKAVLEETLIIHQNLRNKDENKLVIGNNANLFYNEKTKQSRNES